MLPPLPWPRIRRFAVPAAPLLPVLALPALLIALMALGALVPTEALAQDEPPIPAPGQKVPLHAAGGWPTSTTGDDKIPGRTPEQQARLDAVTGELKRLANQYGPDSVVLQSKLLVRAMEAGAAGPTEVQVAGPAGDEAGALEIVVGTGLFFDSSETTVQTRRDIVWEKVAVPVLDEMTSFNIEPDGLDLVFFLDVQDFDLGTPGQPDPLEDATREGFRVRLARPLLEDLISDRLDAAAAGSKTDFIAVASNSSGKED